jgi:hypothetical protein
MPDVKLDPIVGQFYGPDAHEAFWRAVDVIERVFKSSHERTCRQDATWIERKAVAERQARKDLANRAEDAANDEIDRLAKVGGAVSGSSMASG